MSHPQPSTSPRASRSTLARPPARVPRRFAAGTLMVLVAVYGLIIRGLMAVGMPMAGVVTIAGTLTAAGAAQVFLFRGERPRYASIVLGAVAAPISVLLYAIVDAEFAANLFAYSTISETIVLFYYFIVAGGLLGYVTGCIAAGLFLLLGRIPWFQAGLELDNTAMTSGAAPDATTGAFQRFVSSISLYQHERPLREFASLAGILLAVLLPAAIHMPGWRAAYYVPTVLGIAFGLSFLRTGLRQLSRKLVIALVVLSVICSIGPAAMTARINWADGFVTQVPVTGAVIASLLTGLALTATVGWLRWIRRALFQSQGSRGEIVILTTLIIAANLTSCLYIESRLHRPDQAALSRIHELNGSVRYVFPNRNVFEGQVSHIILHSSFVTDNDLRLMSALNTATHLDLSNSRITDEGIIHLRSFPQLSSLYLTSEHITDAGIEQLPQLTKVAVLSLLDTKVTSTGVRSLKPLNIRILSLSGSELDASVLEELADMPMLVSIALHNVDLHGADLSTLARIPFLKSLALVGCNIHDEDLSGLLGMPKLEELRISRNPITNQCIETLPQMQPLRKIDLYETEITANGVEALEAKMPTCVILGL